MAGTINLALTQQFDMDGRPLSGGLLYFFQASTTTPQSAFQDIALIIPHSNPIVLDASGRVPMFYLADGNIKIRLTDDAGVTIIAADNLLVVGGSTSGSGGAGVNPDTVLKTGDIKARFSEGPLTGYVRCNGRTIGKTGSGASELADTDLARSLFEHLWPFASITLNTAKGTNATVDFDNGRLLNLPDLRGRTIAGTDDMGNPAPANRLTTTYFGTSGIVLGNASGLENTALSTSLIPTHTHDLRSGIVYGGNLGISSEVDAAGNNQDHVHAQGGTFGTDGMSVGHDHDYNKITSVSKTSVQAGGGATVVADIGTTASATSGASADHTHNVVLSGNTGGRSNGHYHYINGTTQPQGGAGSPAHANVQPTMVLTFYMKL
jgi:microcystin-dependent protein